MSDARENDEPGACGAGAGAIPGRAPLAYNPVPRVRLPAAGTSRGSTGPPNSMNSVGASMGFRMSDALLNTPDRGEKHYKSVHHCNKVLVGFEQLWQDTLMTDTVLVVDGERFRVHRCFLAACSHYFYSMFTENFQESQQKEVELKGVTAPGLQALLQYAYTGEVVLSQSRLHDVVEAAAHLQFLEVLDFCAQYLRDQLTIDNCLQFLHMADLYELRTCEQDIKTFILHNFVAVAQNEAFQDISTELLCEFLSDDRLTSDTELEVFEVVLKWLDIKEDKQTLAGQVLSLVRYGLMDPTQMEKVYCHQLMLSEECRNILQDALSYHMKLFQQPVLHTPMAKLRACRESLVVLGAGKTDNVLCPYILAARQEEDGTFQDFVKLGNLKDKRYFASVVTLNNFVFVVGGQTAMAGDGSHATNTAFRYNARDGKWLQISSMRTPRTHFALVALKDCLIAVGGKHNRVALSSAEKYTFHSNEWSLISGLPNTLFSHAGCAHRNRLYISGGCPGEDFTDHVHCYDPDRDGWQLKAPMNQSRGYHVMVSYNDKVFVCAGNTNAGNRADVLNAEAYDPETDQWTVLSSSRHGQSEAPGVQWDDRVYIVGGYSWNERSFQDTVQCYSMANDEWEELDIHMTEPMTGVIACRVQLPNQLFDLHAIKNG